MMDVDSHVIFPQVLALFLVFLNAQLASSKSDAETIVHASNDTFLAFTKFLNLETWVPN